MRTALRRTLALGALGLALAGAAAPSAWAAEEFDKYALESVSAGLSTRQAGAHPDMTIAIQINRNGNSPYANTKDIEVRLPPGMAGNPKAVPTCTPEELGAGEESSACPVDSQVGMTRIRVIQPVAGVYTEPVYNMTTPKGMLARLGFMAVGWPVFINVRLDPEDHTAVSRVEGIPAASGLSESTTTLWGVPASPVHDEERITPDEAIHGETPEGGREVNIPEKPFLLNPTECTQERRVTVTADSYQLPERSSTMSASFPPIVGCGLVDFNPTTALKATTSQASSGSGLEYHLSLPATGLEAPNVLFGSEVERDEVVLPEGMTINPSEAEGLGVCSEADLARETFDSGPNAGCPETSKIGSVEASSPVVDEKAEGALYLAKPYENPSHSLIALYMVLKVPDRGVIVKMAGKVEPDPQTGQLITTFDDIPQLPVSDFTLHFKEGARAPLITPRTCGRYDAISNLTPWATPASPLARLNPFAIESGPGHGACPAGATPPFDPGFSAYPTDFAAGSFSPFYMRLTRKDGDQDLTKFSATLPPGLVAKLAGTSECSDAAIAQARSRTGQNGGHEELASPSCPQSSEIGRVLAGAGVGDSLTYVEGHVYLAGPYKGAPLSVVAIVPAVAGPFDVGTVVTRQALRLDPRSGVVTVDGESSDPIPHILAGIPLSVRDVRVYVDKPDFTLNPTSCEPFATEATVWGGGADVFSAGDDSPLSLAARFRAADCAALGFKPRLGLALRGGTLRGGHPALRGVYSPRKGDANMQKLVLRLPHSAFLDQAHIRTICTRVQFAADGGNGGGCPKGAVYGHAVAYTPILEKPLEGPVYLRSSNHNLPDFVAALHGLVDVEAVARIDSVHGGIRATFTGVPDAPLTKVVVNMQGGKKGLIINSRNLCHEPGRNRANALYGAHNGRQAKSSPVMRAVKCGKAKHRKHRRHHR
jgi:hypothetical protein